MKLTEQQLLILQDTLKERITYKETYDEVYDHTLSALENSDDTFPLVTKLERIMHNDFGGVKGLRTLERKRRWLVARQMIGQQWVYFLDNFRLPLLPLTLTIFAGVYYIITNVEYNAFHIFLAIVLIPNIFNGLRHFNFGYRLKSTNKSIKDFPLKVISYVPYYMFFIGNAIIQSIIQLTSHPVDFMANRSWYNLLGLPPVVISFVFGLYIIYNLSFYRLYKDEFNKLKLN
jgi:hypothetical protein